ncbi:response regulator [Caldicellulosiruptoraceae bacterium PP1]
MKRILIVDDAAFIRASLRQLLEKNGFEVVGEANDGNTGVLKYFELKPDIVLMDITMPNMNGIDAIKEIKKGDSKAKIIVVSAMGQESFVKDAILSGAINFIVKPYKEEHLIMALNKIN